MDAAKTAVMNKEKTNFMVLLARSYERETLYWILRANKCGEISENFLKIFHLR